MTRVERRALNRKRKVLRVVAAVTATVFAISLLVAFSRPEEVNRAENLEIVQASASQPLDNPVQPMAVEPEAEEIVLAKMLWGEARGCSKTQQAAVIWCALNRVDSDDPFYPEGIVPVVLQPSQFHGYSHENPVEPALLALVQDVLARWSIEKQCIASVGRVLPKEYLFFHGDGTRNHFRTAWDGGVKWDWSINSPYEED